jgi:CheY-like chemotaxis protein
MGKEDKKKPVVLVVEDEAVIRMNIVQVAEEAGYEVLEAANAHEAIEILEGRNDIGVVFTDVAKVGPCHRWQLAVNPGGSDVRT